MVYYEIVVNFLYILESLFNCACFACLHLPVHMPVSVRYPKLAFYISFLLLTSWILVYY